LHLQFVDTVTSDSTEGAEPPATFDCVSFHDRVNSGSGVSGDHDGRNGSVAIYTKMAEAKPLLTHALEYGRVIHLNGLVARGAFQATILDNEERWEIVALSDDDIVQDIFLITSQYDIKTI
jgi:hypothetical protein